MKLPALSSSFPFGRSSLRICTWKAKVSDFNLSKLMADAAAQSGSSAGGATNPRWLAPEVLKGAQAGRPADVFSFGEGRTSSASVKGRIVAFRSKKVQARRCTVIKVCTLHIRVL